MAVVLESLPLLRCQHDHNDVLAKANRNEALDSSAGEALQDFWWVQITIGVIALIVGPIFLLREPTRDHLFIAAALVLIGGSALSSQ